MPVFRCFRGDCANLALEEADCFLFKDALGRDWFCVQTELSEIPEDFGSVVGDMLRAQALAHKHGLSAEGTEQRLLLAPDAEALQRELILSTYPPVKESRTILQRAGWLQGLREEFGTGQPYRVWVSNGHQTIQAEGENLEEAWYRAAQRALQEKNIMIAPLQPDPVPLRDDGRGGFRVGKSRVPLEVVLREYENGADPESIVSAYPTLDLADVYAVIAYYLHHREEVKSWLGKREAEAAELRREIESQQSGRAELRAKLLERRTQQEQEHASARS